jgi:hypothetical protein
MSTHDSNNLMKRAMVLAILAAVSVGMAECSRGGGNVRSACNTEIGKLCAGEDHPGQCLRKHPDELSDSCRQALVNAPANRGGNQ